MAVLRQIWLYEGIGGTLPMCQNSTMRVNGAWIKRYCISCSKTYNTSHSCHNFPAGSRQATRGTRICQTSLLWHIVAETKWPLPFCRHSQINYFYEKICIFIQISLKLVSQYLTNRAAIQNMGYYNEFDTTKSLGVCYWCVKIPQRRYMGHVLKLITFYVQKHYWCVKIPQRRYMGHVLKLITFYVQKHIAVWKSVIIHY